MFAAYTSNLRVTELAKTHQIPAFDITLSENPSAEHCVFLIKDFGNGYEDSSSQLHFGLSFSTKKVITSHLKKKKEMPNGGAAGRDIRLAAADDCYLTF